jgi:hypothetical protein
MGEVSRRRADTFVVTHGKWTSEKKQAVAGVHFSVGQTPLSCPNKVLSADLLHRILATDLFDWFFLITCGEEHNWEFLNMQLSSLSY